MDCNKGSGRQGMVAGCLIIWGVLFTPVYCQTSSVMLLIQPSPPHGGTIIPNAGVHDFQLNAEVTVIATPKPGYQFVHWLGDVIDPTASTTVVYLNKPKIIIAVFEETQYGLSFGGGGGPSPVSGVEYWRPSGGGYIPPGPPPKPPPIPEPATGLLLALGGLALLRKCRA